MLERARTGEVETLGSFIGSVVLTASNSQRSTAFWQPALGYVAQPNNPEFLVPPEWSPPSNTRNDHMDGVHLHVDAGDRPHIDLWVEDGDSQDSEVERLVALGARRVEWTYPEDAQHVVLADPDGNLFCVCA